jgi:hypothetical protein
MTDAKQAAKELKAAQAEWKSVGPAPREKHEALWERFKKAADDLHGKTRERFAELDEARAANLKKKEELCARVEALADSTDWKESGELIKLLQEEWKAVGPTPKADSDAVWTRFRAACDRFFERKKAHFGQLDEERQANLKRQEELCARAEALADSSEWKSTAAELKALQAEWKTVGPAPRESADAVWTRFRAACDRFFERRKAAFAAEDSERAENLRKKEEMCARVEAMSGLDEEPGSAIKKLMTEWKAIGPAPRDQADAVWERFRAACDRLRGEQAAPQPAAPAAPPVEPFRFTQLADQLAAVKTAPVASAVSAPSPAPAASPPPPADKPSEDVEAGWLALDATVPDKSGDKPH